MKAVSVLSACVCLSACLLAFSGCSKRQEAGPVLEIEQVGLSLPLPAGWKVDRNNPWVFRKDEAIGRVVYELREGRGFEECVDAMLRADGGVAVSRAQEDVGGRRAVEVVAENREEGTRGLRLFVFKDEMVVEISAEMPAKMFAREEAAVRAALRAARIVDP